ncbi:hypothetical protein [Candidatus Borrarchaeum sp.]|nr:hypothetical protein [Candidatus Borrarchaeum sp.]
MTDDKKETYWRKIIKVSTIPATASPTSVQTWKNTAGKIPVSTQTKG